MERTKDAMIFLFLGFRCRSLNAHDCPIGAYFFVNVPEPEFFFVNVPVPEPVPEFFFGLGHGLGHVHEKISPNGATMCLRE
jgi:hypothetical protein